MTAALLALLLAATPVAARPIAITHVAIVDVEAGTIVRDRSVVIERGRITAIGDAFAVPRGARRVDGRGGYLVPGLVDMHVHLFNNASKRAPNDWAFPLFVASGVIGVREMAASPADVERAVARQSLAFPYDKVGNNLDSIGLFQQRPSKGWGTIKQIMDPYYSSGKFYDALLGVKNWRTDDINDVAQKVQRSAHPDAYRKHVSKAQALAAALTGVQPGGLTCKAGSPAKADAAGLTALMRKALAGEVKVTRTEKGLIVQGSTQQRAWAAAAFAVAYSDAYGVARVTLGGADWALDTSSLAPWTGNGTGSIVTVSFGK